MVCDGAMIASTIVSMMTNGVCCMWQHQEEMDRRETIRRDIRVEYWQQRLIDHELMMAQYQEQQDRRHEGQQHLTFSTTAVGRGDPTRARLYSDSSTSGFLEEQTADERRKQLLMDKRKASSDNRRIQQQQQEDRRVSPGSVTQREQPTVSSKSNESLPPVSLMVKPRHLATSPRVEATDYRWRDECSKTSPVTLEDMGRTSSRAYSLVDSDDEDDEDNFMDVPLR